MRKESPRIRHGGIAGHREAIPIDSGVGSRAARAPGSSGRTQRGLRQFSRSVAGVVVAGSGKGELHPEVDVGRLRLRPSGLLVLGLPAGTARAARLAVEHPIRTAGLLPGSLASRAPLPRVPAAPLAGFSLDPRLALFVATIHRVRGACHVIVAPLVTRVAAEHGLPDWWGHTGNDAHDAPEATVVSIGPALVFERLWRETGCQAVVHRRHSSVGRVHGTTESLPKPGVVHELGISNAQVQSVRFIPNVGGNVGHP